MFTIRPAALARGIAARGIAAALLTPALALVAGLGPAQAVPIQVTLSQDQLTNQPGTDSWTWALPQTPSLSLPANGTLQLEFAFEGGFLRLHDLGGAPDDAQRQHRDGLLDRLATQQASRAQLETEIAQLDAELADQQATRVGLLGQLQEKEADLAEVKEALQVAQQEVETVRGGLNAITDALVTAQNELEEIVDAMTSFIGDLLSNVYQELIQSKNEALDKVQGLLQARHQTIQQLEFAESEAQAKEVVQNNLAVQTTILETALDTLDGVIASLEAQKSDAEGRRSVLMTLISVTDRELAQLPEDVNAEGVEVSLDGASGNSIPLFAQVLLDIAAGNPATSSPFLQGEFLAQAQLLAYADITPSFVDIAGFTLQLDLFGPPGENLSLYSLTFGLLADDVSIVSRAGAAPVPEPATIALLAGGLAGLGWLRRRDRLRMV